MTLERLRLFTEKYHINDATGCWDWLSTKHRDGYGKITIRGESCWAHRVAYELFVGPISPGLEIDHLCRNRGCVNPAHLEPVSKRENCLRGVSFAASNAKKTHCVNGHPFDASNTYVRSDGSRICRRCRVEAVRRRRKKKAAA